MRPFAITDVRAWRVRLDRWLAASDLLRSSEEDLRWIDPSLPPLETAAQLLESGPAVAVVTRGAAGAAVLSPAGMVEVSATPTDVTDTVGAGDSFTGALLTWLHRRDVGGRSAVLALSAEDWREALQFSSMVAAVTCSRVGADPPWASEMEDR